MATKTWVLERLAKAEEAVEKKTATIERARNQYEKNVAKLEKVTGTKFTGYSVDLAREYRSANNFEALDILYKVRDKMDSIESNQKALAEKSAMVEKYKNDLAEIEAKEASRNIQVIIDFLNQWKEMCYEWYLEQWELFKVAEREFNENVRTPYTNYKYHEEHTPEEMKSARIEYDKAYKKFNKHWTYVTKFLNMSDTYAENVKKVLDREAIAKYDDLVERVIRYTGEITDASHLYIAINGNLNGYIVGKDGSADVETIGAGGYNIQCYHYRTLVHKRK